jgi:hypothetical protein
MKQRVLLGFLGFIIATSLIFLGAYAQREIYESNPIYIPCHKTFKMLKV